MSGANLSNTDMRRAFLFRVNLERANLSGADLTYADLRDTNLKDADLSQARLPQGQLGGTNIDFALREKTDLNRANLRGTRLGTFPCVLTAVVYCVKDVPME